MTWKKKSLERCHRFLYSWQDTEPVPCIDFLKVKSLDTTCFKTAWDNKLVSHPWYFSAFIRPKVHSRSYQMPTLFSKEHVISGSHPENSVCGWDPLDPSKSDPSDPDCLGHPIHFQLTVCGTIIIILFKLASYCLFFKLPSTV